MVSLFSSISIILAIVLAISLIMRLLKQPLIIGYIVAGIIVGPLVLNILPQGETVATFSELGIAFLLFIVGLHLNPKIIKEVGKISLVTGVGQVLFTAAIGYAIALWLGFSHLTAAYVSVALTFSSTIIIMKLLSDKDALDTLYGKVSIGFLLVQDLIAIIILIVVSSLSGGNASGELLSLLIKGAGVILILTLLYKLVLSRIDSFLSKSQEFLFVFSIAWGLGLAYVFSYIGLSIEVGALVAGIMLSMAPYSYEVSSKLKPLRDFFIITFFILLGSQMTFAAATNYLIPALIFSAFILIGNPLIVMALMGYFGYSKKIGFMAGLTVAQISEFSLILIALGAKLGHLQGEILSFVTVIGLLTIAGSTYMIIYSDNIYGAISKYLGIFERKSIKDSQEDKKNYEYVLMGENRIGFSIMKAFKKMKKEYLVVDYNPQRVKRLNKSGVHCVYGDVSDTEFFEELRLEKLKLVVSTIPELETNMILVKKIREKNDKTIIIVTGRQISDAFELYKAGANYVILPHFLGGEYAANLIERARENLQVYNEEKDKQIKDLKERKGEGQEHPEVEKENSKNKTKKKKS